MEAKQDSAVMDLTPRIVAQDVAEALEPLGVVMPGLDVMVKDALCLAGACRGQGWRDRDACDFLQEFASRVLLRRGTAALGWNFYVAICFRAMGQGRDAGGERRIRGARDIDAPVHKEDGGVALGEVIAAPSQDHRGSLDAELPAHVEVIANFLRDAPAKTIAKARGVSARQGRLDTANLIQATARAVRDPGLFGPIEIDPEAWASRPKHGKGGRRGVAQMVFGAMVKVIGAQQQSLF